MGPRQAVLLLRDAQRGINMATDASATERTIINTNTLTHLQFNNDDKNPKHALPSWCPDYSTEPDWPHRGYTPIICANTDNFNASRSSCWSDTTLTATSISPLQGSGELHLRGVDFDVVEYVGPDPYMAPYKGEIAAERFDNIIARNAETKRHVIAWEQEVLAKWEQNNCPYPRLGIESEEAFWRTLMWDRDWSRHRLTSSRAQHFLAWLGRADIDASHAAAEARAGNDEVEARRTFVKPFTDCAITRCHARSFVITSKGFIGLAPFRSRVGDLITVLQNGDVPFVLRRRPVASEAHSDSDVVRPVKAPEVLVPCEFVGEAFVLGIMDGEAVAQAGEEDVKVFVLT